MMGCGKSFFSKIIAKKLKVGGYDLDYLVEVTEKKTIPEIFDKNGEEYFRKTEARLLRWFQQKEEGIIATGGGTPCFYDNMQWMNENGITIWLNEPIAVLMDRLEKAKDTRPLIKNFTSNAEMETFLVQKLEERQPIYQQATYTLQPSTMLEKEIAIFIKNL